MNTATLHTPMIEYEDGPGPYGSKGAGEGGILAIAAAVGAAVNQSPGVQLRELPMTPERVRRAVRDRATTSAAASYVGGVSAQETRDGA